MERLRFGRYETLRRIASGGMASVYLGRAVGPAGFERLVAIKVMHEHILGDPEFRGMFLDEARLAAKIRHPNVVPTLDVSADGRFIVMDFIEGASLRDLLKQRIVEGRGPLPVEVTLRILLDALAGLQAAHQLEDRDGTPLHLVHRDISPHNVLVGVDGISRITDFGIALAEARITSTKSGQLKGKLPYMAPEQLEVDEVDRRVDIYAAGCVLWEMLAGQRLFAAKHEGALARMILAGPPSRPSDHNPAVPAGIDDACMQALAPCDARFRSAEAFAEALEAAAAESGLRIARPREVAALLDVPKLAVSLAGDVPPRTFGALREAAATLPNDLANDLATGELPSDAAETVSEAATTIPESVPGWARELRDQVASEPPPVAVHEAITLSADSPHTATISAGELAAIMPKAARPVAVGGVQPSSAGSSMAKPPATELPATLPSADPDDEPPAVDEDGTSVPLVRPVPGAPRARGSFLLAAVVGPILVVAAAWALLGPKPELAAEEPPSAPAPASAAEEASTAEPAPSSASSAAPRASESAAPLASASGSALPRVTARATPSPPVPAAKPPAAPSPPPPAASAAGGVFHPPRL